MNTRTRVTENADKALAQYEDLRASGDIVRSVVIAELKNGSFELLGAGLRPYFAGKLLTLGLSMIKNAMEQHANIRPEPLGTISQGGETVGTTLQEKAVKTGADGNLIPPPGEAFISCSECRHPRWHILLRQHDQQPARFACAHCGNEVVLHVISNPTRQ